MHAKQFTLDERLLDHLPAGVVVHDVRSAVLAANREAQKLLGLDLGGIVGRKATDPAWHFIQRDGSAMAVPDFPVVQALREQRAISDLVLGVLTEGVDAVRWLICNAYPVFNADHTVQSVVVCFTDCTELVRAQDLLQQSEQRLQLVLRGANDASWDWHLDADRMYYSPRWWTMLGYPADTPDSSPARWVQFLDPADRDRTQDTLHSVLSGDADSYSLEFSLQHRDGHYVPVQSKGCILRDSAGRATRIAGTNVDLTERKRFERQLILTADHDHLTGLPNRRYLSRQLEATLADAASTSARGAVLLIDLDDFKLLNDTEGHAVGDLLLRAVAARLLGAVGAGDFVGRLGGDEFVVILAPFVTPGHDFTAGVLARCVALQAALCQPYRLGESDHRVTPSFGCVFFGDAATSADTVLKQADIALYAAKSAGRNTVRIFEPAMQDAIEARARLQSELRHAIAHGDLELYYQPQFDANRRLTGAEALLRWNHAGRGLITPGAFIEAAETSDLIIEIGHWVLDEACRRLASWARDPALRDIALSINISARHLQESDFVARSLSILQRAGADPARLTMELTEGVLIDDTEETIEKMRALRACGVGFSLDDFGTGFSSLRYIHRFPLKNLKIDQSFVASCNHDPHAGAIVEIVIALAKKLSLGNIAEGVETVEQFGFLTSLGCTGFQGYLLGRPMPAAQFELLARTTKAGAGKIPQI
ncbi:putative bifunctional diguanylate cyclase/phosphodiesterase [Massilia sp. S19_KUP03_FR1]|uniref:putative bifunctional diguanylate cyclase/phosphodiesterase n=1 Tax=Massilia sp. S19_KUP03_FR1 TaxID=3025503 RepID=UPI002FCCC02E